VLTEVVWLIVKHPRYSGTSRIVKVESKDHFNQLIGTNTSGKPTVQKGTPTSRRDLSKVQQVLVVFNANWIDTCLHTYSMWARFSNKYTT